MAEFEPDRSDAIAAVREYHGTSDTEMYTYTWRRMAEGKARVNQSRNSESTRFNGFCIYD